MDWSEVYVFPDGALFHKKQRRFLEEFIVDGYRCVDGKYGPLRIHGIVARKYVIGQRPGLVVDHIDGNKLNNQAENLRWVTRKQNLYAWRVCQRFLRSSQS